MRKIVTEYWRKPIPTSHFDWAASFDGDEPNDEGHMAMGHGGTEQEAIEDLIEDMVDEYWPVSA